MSKCTHHVEMQQEDGSFYSVSQMYRFDDDRIYCPLCRQTIGYNGVLTSTAIDVVLKAVKAAEWVPVIVANVREMDSIELSKDDIIMVLAALRASMEPTQRAPESQYT